MDYNNILEYYLALLQVQMAVLGFVIAGIVALIQMLNEAKPRRQMHLLIRNSVLSSYIGGMTLILGLLALASWTMTAPKSATAHFGQGLVDFFGNGGVLLCFLAACILGLLMFAVLTYRARLLLDPRLYLSKYIVSVPIAEVRNYLKEIYADPVRLTQTQEQRKRRVSRDIAKFKRYFEREQTLYDPFQPIREYIKDNAFKSYDFGTAAGLKLFSSLFDRTLQDVRKNPRKDEYYYLAKYLSENALEYFAIFEKTSSEKRKDDIIRLVYLKGRELLEVADNEGLLTIVRCLEGIAKLTDDDDEIIAVVGYIHALTEAYLDRHKTAKWTDIAPAFEEICLSVTRLSETYYLQKDNPLKTVPIIGHYTGEYRTVTAALVDFFRAYKDLADRYTDAYPQYYFEAIEAVVEALFARLHEVVENGQQSIGLNATYHDLAYALTSLYSIFGLDAIEHKKPELLALCMSNLRRIIKPSKNLKLETERTSLTMMFIELAIKGVIELGDVPVKADGRTITEYAKQTLEKHASKNDVVSSLDRLVSEGVKLDKPELKALLTMMRAIKNT